MQGYEDADGDSPEPVFPHDRTSKGAEKGKKSRPLSPQQAVDGVLYHTGLSRRAEKKPFERGCTA